MKLNPVVPPGATSVAARAVHYQDYVFDVSYGLDDLTLRLSPLATRPLILVDAMHRTLRLSPGSSVSLPLGPTSLHPQRGGL